MAFEYGAKKLNIRNPFRFEGMVRSVRGLIVLAIGVYLLLQIQSLLQTDKTSAWISLALGGLYVAGGLKALGGGLFQMMRFFVGRAAPASLAKNVAREAVNEAEPSLYDARSLHNMMMSKSNPTFVEPKTWFARAVHSIFPNLIVTPWPIRNMAQLVAMKLTKSLIAIAAYLVSSLVVYMVFAGTAGGGVGNTVLSLLMQAALFIYLAAVWVKLPNPLSRGNMTRLNSATSGGLALVVIGAIVIPVLFSQGWTMFWESARSGVRANLAEMVPQLAPMFHTGSLLVLAIVGGLVTVAIATIMVKARIGLVQINTNSSEMNNSWRFDLHPRQIFTTLRDLVLMERRQMELPNRMYLDKNNTGDANRDNEQFDGDMVVEIQPSVEEVAEPGSLRWTRIAGTILGQVLMLAGALLLWLGVERTMGHVAMMSAFVQNGVSQEVFNELFLIPAGGTVAIVFGALLLMGFGRSIARICHLFWSEIFFKSNLFDLHCEGTVMRTTHFRGADRHSASSEQDMFAFDATYFALATEAVSSTFAVSGQQNLEQPRYLLSLRGCDGFLNGVVGDLEDQFRRRNEEFRNEKRADQDERLDYIRREQEARRTGDMSAQGLVAPEARAALEESPLEGSADREKVARWEGESSE
ncbi:hypothetical protein FWJ25_03070 [Marinobacter salinexigens]|uniref:Uncharacterized protein n=1 Tax=Marinobacter salinexigens TaxID=2919747 RepID=A0A5B0VPB2_9GAMM|nr:hypothetical protein [Marinobacter salinexigens]KAA1176128.1 hypothetical protein FWJ25_03070 [Marinobacter salinexigens]